MVIGNIFQKVDFAWCYIILSSQVLSTLNNIRYHIRNCQYTSYPVYRMLAIDLMLAINLTYMDPPGLGT